MLLEQNACSVTQDRFHRTMDHVKNVLFTVIPLILAHVNALLVVQDLK